MSGVKSAQSKRSKRTLNLLEQLVRDQVMADVENMEKEEMKPKKTAGKGRKKQLNGDIHQNGHERKGRDRNKRSQKGNKAKELAEGKGFSVPKASSPRKSRSRSNSGSSFWSNGKDSRESSRSRSRSCSFSRSQSRSRSRSGCRSGSYSRSRSRSYSRSRSRSYSTSRSRSSSRSRSGSRSRSRSASLETPRSKSSEEPSQSTTKSLPVKTVKAKDRDVMSDIVSGSSKKKPPSGHRQGKLLKRRQMKKFKSMEIDPDALIEERLRQKYRELDEIMKGKTVKTNTITRQYIGQMERLREQYHMVSHGLAPPGLILPRSMSQELRVKGHLDQSSHGRQRPLSGGSYNSELSNKSTDMAYKSMQNIIYQQNNPKHEYLPIKPRKKRSKRRKNSESTLENSSFHSQTTATTQKTDVTTPMTTPRDVTEQERMNYHIKYSSKEELRLWLKEKDKLHRKKVKQERAKKRAEREKMILEANEKFEKRLEAQKIYKVWAEKKNKEISEQKRQERKEHKRILKEYEEKNEKKNIRPESAPLKRKETSSGGGIKVEGTTETNVNLRQKSSKSGNESSLLATPHPPASKFIYKRPVAGRIKLAVNGKSPDRNKVEQQERPKTASSSRSRSAEGNRMSYDQWVLQKRKQDQKKKEMEEKHKQDQMSKSDPDLNKIIPDIAKKRVHNVLEGKKRIDTGVKRIDEKLNKKFGGGDFGSEEREKEADEQVRYSYRLESDRTATPSNSGQINVSGTAIKRPPSGVRRPQTAPAGRVPPPKKSSGSPRQAVVPKLEDVMNDEDTSNPFKLPFPAEAGVPKHVASRQRKLFAEQVWERLESEERPEPQGCDVPEPATCVSMNSPPASDSGDKGETDKENGNSSPETDKTSSSEVKSEKDEDPPEEEVEEEEEEGEKDSKVFLTQFNSTDNLNKIENEKSDSSSDDKEETPKIERLDLNFTENSQKEDVSDQEVDEEDEIQTENDNTTDNDVTGEDTLEEDVQNSEVEESKDTASNSEQNTDKEDDKTKTGSTENENEASSNVDILNLELENTTRSSKRVSFNEAPEVFQTEDWSTDTQTPDEESFRGGLDDSANAHDKDFVTSSLDDDF